MKALKITKMNLRDMIKPTIVFYCIILAVITGTIMMNKIAVTTLSEGEVSMGTLSGGEFGTIIFLFVCGLNSFKTNFLFVKSNNISRKTFIKGILISAVPIAFVVSVVDIILSRITNLFVASPTLYDIGYGNLSKMGGHFFQNGWVQSNSLETLFNTFLLQFVLCAAAYLIGLVINMIYYRSNKIMKAVVSVVPIVFIVIMNTLAYKFPETINHIVTFINYIFGAEPSNVYAAVTTFTIIAMACALGAFMLIRKAEIKEK